MRIDVYQCVSMPISSNSLVNPWHHMIAEVTHRLPRLRASIIRSTKWHPTQLLLISNKSVCSTSR
ncbi:hypothetical protein K493DRAFT_408075 [Basidiobolus meristosporus CBS 931.73]|uniref:Uncharacterized protein n=1 Tax=Basidiobolus meristosporus CBS 931.73 TaxID=1314790 RepID=A0A1Y1Y9J8_9FUNG|nr:hypothetical protein K493DRAFT_408075 [Basidiobolus meristosporus CBS 931.73]|eukprot:ORX94244.1 hypothetical protein K493DRAFT_408075 [Basidiobolus meristosporus CBS 931.73]